MTVLPTVLMPAINARDVSGAYLGKHWKVT
jgi:hypothetical protein